MNQGFEERRVVTAPREKTVGLGRSGFLDLWDHSVQQESLVYRANLGRAE